MNITEKDKSRFWAKVKRGAPDECWEWAGWIRKDGYGGARLRGKHWLAHRVAWMMTNGEIPLGLCGCHHCDNKKCCNPDHLFLGTYEDNSKDMDSKGRRVTSPGEKNGRAKLTAEQVLVIRSLSGKMSLESIGINFGISHTSVWRIQLRKRWKHL